MTPALRYRSVLTVPGSNPRMIEKGLASATDAVILDLEDAVAPAEKAHARSIVVEALRHGDWQGRQRTVRINGLDTTFCYGDIVWLVEHAGDHIGSIVLPKIDHPDQVRAIDQWLGLYERASGRTEPIEMEVQIESAAGLVHCEAIATSSPRVAALIFGPGDFAASTGIPASNIGMVDQWDVAYGGHRWHYALSRIQLAARAAGCRAIDGPFADFRDARSLRRSATMSRALGFDGKWCIHPAQIEVVNEVFSPRPDEIERARAILTAYEAALERGSGAVALHGEMLDAASLRVAQRTLAAAGEE
jgi:citrate lyase beta subunit